MTRGVIAISFCLFASAAFGQGGLGTMSGTVTDPDGGLIAGATVQAKDTTTETIYTASTLRTGSFTLSELPAGTYELSVPAIGFTFVRYVRQNIVVQAGQTLRSDIRLEWSVNLGTIGDDTFLTIRNRYAGLSGSAPRTPDGKPDLSGIWNGSRDPNPELPAALPWAADIQRERRENNGRDFPSAYCLPGEVFPQQPLLYKFVQTPTLLVQLFEDIPSHRQVFLDGRGHPKDPDPTWKGHSIGKWEGETLIIDTVGFSDKSWLPANLPHTEMLHIVERYRRTDLAHLAIDVTIEDPGTLMRPWNLHMVWDLAPGEEILEYVCENNQYRPQ